MRYWYKMLANNTSFIAPSVDDSDMENSVSELAYFLIEVVITLVGVAANAMVLLVVMKKKSMRSTTNLLLSNVATSDLITLVASREIFVKVESKNLGNFFCKFVVLIPSFTACSSALTLAAVAIERYHALVKPFESGLRLTKRGVKFAVVAVWIVSLASVVPLMIYSYYNKSFPDDCRYSWDDKTRNGYGYATASLLLFTPSIVIFFCYGSIIYGVKCGTISQTEDFHSKLKMVRKLAFVTVLFLLCHGVYGFFFLELVEVKLDPILLSFLDLLLYFNCAINPWIYAFQSLNYRAAIREMFVCCGKLGKVHARLSAVQPLQELHLIAYKRNIVVTATGNISDGNKTV